MSFVSQWDALERELPERWSEARLVVVIGEADGDRAAALLAPAHPLRRGDAIHLFASRSAGVGTEAVRRLLGRLDRAGFAGTLGIEGAVEGETRPPVRSPSLSEAWDTAVTTLPADWSDLLGEVRLTSTDHLERAALLMSPMNPSRAGGVAALRFRAARRFGYGVSATMLRRCLARLDDAGIPGELQVLRVLSDTHNVSTQGPVWRVGGKAV